MFCIQAYADNRPKVDYGPPFMSMAKKIAADRWRGSQTRAFGEVLQRIRTERGLTQDSLAVHAGTERSHISALERAEKAPSFATLLKLAAALDMSAAQLVDLVEQQLRHGSHDGGESLVTARAKRVMVTRRKR